MRATVACTVVGVGATVLGGDGAGVTVAVGAAGCVVVGSVVSDAGDMDVGVLVFVHAAIPVAMLISKTTRRNLENLRL